ncbi:LOW QUALITY PROTEIN: endoplasmic reticulum aminopeptidase 1-like [Phyllopteryx taeniolatus]|uniref:LOW QUALITY PROTEIN: endoplasmic reticulum aminopeptidase 1-like n=1 Tax=Phyllopteryx taeniolatus TaxID=161469 RepID=UPI002AD2B024|nr:LOW QUALITY PROTEIN: endoplasmic reticulum aminopeptidase 1-like [Phyllopteryx taeniolatus]
MLVAPVCLMSFLYLGQVFGAQIPYENSRNIPGAQPFPWHHMRLPQTVMPLHYDLTIHPNLTTLNFTGVVRIQLEVLENTKAIVLHTKQLKIFNVKLKTPEGVRSLQVVENSIYQQLALLSDEVITRGADYEVHMEFSAKLSDSYHGFYKSSYRTSSGQLRILASTQFEATFARAAFPCFDEPAFKANFTISIIREARHIAISNMPKIKTIALPGNVFEDAFGTTVKMSTYLVAFIVSDFLSVSKMTKHGVKISVYAVAEKINQTDFALDTAVKLLDFYDTYFNIPYPLPKQDLAAIPDFQAGAMENWGLTTYREAALLFHPEKSSMADKAQIAKIIAHELAHQWFGNLVTMEWWSDLWLNEGFAKFMEFIAVDFTCPELQANDLFLGKCYNAMEVDGLSSSHPIFNPVENPTEIQEMFDEVSYDKGACILNMLKDFMTPEVFEVGIIRYLKRYSYRNTVSSHLWESLTDICNSNDLHDAPSKRKEFCSKRTLQSGKYDHGDKFDIKTIMDTWTRQKGFPLVSVDLKGRKLILTQHRYLKIEEKPTTTGPPTETLVWQIPLTYKTSASDTTQHFLMRSAVDLLRIPNGVDWIKLNVDMSGYYIVHYGKDGWKTMIKLLQNNHTALSGKDRASLIHDAFRVVSIKKLTLETALELSTYLSKETNVIAVTQGFAELIPIYKLIERREIILLENSMKIYMLHLFKDLIDSQRWDDSGSSSERMLRSYLLLFACVRNYTPCVTKASQLFNMWKDSDGKMSLPVEVTLAVYAVGAQTPEGWDFLFEFYRRSLQLSVQSRIKIALTISPLRQKLKWILEQSLLGEVMKTQDLPDVLVSISRNPRGHRLAWDFLRANWATLIKKFEIGSSSIAHMVTGVTSLYSTKTMLTSVEKFFTSLTVETGSQMRCIEQAYDTIADNIRWAETNFPVLQSWLKKSQRWLHEDL